MISETEHPIARCQAIKVKVVENGKGVYLTLLIKKTLPEEEFLDGLHKLEVGDVFNFYATVDHE